MPFAPKSVSLYPKEPGVYLMRSASNEVLYVGKAKNLQGRLSQYFAKERDSRPYIAYLVPQIESIEVIVTKTEKDALILEDTLIKRHQPKYNILLKDDKSFIRLLLTKHPWPMLQIFRSKKKPPATDLVFGPFTSATVAKETLDLLLSLFPLRQCSDREFLQRVRPCLLYDAKRCLAPCVQKCSKAEYEELVQGVVEFLRGNTKLVVKRLQDKMFEASEKLAFEEAARYATILRHIEEKTTLVESRFSTGCDVFGVYQEKNTSALVVLEFREGRLIGSREYLLENTLHPLEVLLPSCLLQHYEKEKSTPQEILVPFSVEKEVQDLLIERYGKAVTLSFPKRGQKREWIDMANHNAKALLTRTATMEQAEEQRLFDLQEVLSLSQFPKVIECIDTSHFSGSSPVASIVRFVHGKRDKAHTRFFRVHAGEDYGAMREALLRHLERKKEEGDFPNLLLLDGGKGQLHLAQDVVSQLDITGIDLCAISKEEARHDKGLTQEKLYVEMQEEPIQLEAKSPLLFFLQTIRDAAHLASISYQKRKRIHSLRSSLLDQVPGIGEKKKQRLLTHFRSVAAIERASPEELSQVVGISKKDIETLQKFFSTTKDTTSKSAQYE